MRSPIHILSALSALLLVRAAGAQVIPGNENDLTLNNGWDLMYVYDDPSIGPPVGTSGVPDFATNSWFWKVMPKETLLHRTGVMEATGLDFLHQDGDFGVTENGNNTAFADYFVSGADTTNPPLEPGLIEPDQADPNGVLISFGPGGPKNNVFITDPGCAPTAYAWAYEIDVDLTGGAGPGAGIPILADGLHDLCLTTFVPGAGHTYSGPNTCGDDNGDGAVVDGHSSNMVGAIGETPFDLDGGGNSRFGGFGTLGMAAGTDGVHEAPASCLQFAEPTLAMVVNSATGQGLEEGLAGVHYNCPVGAGGSIGARLYAWQGLGRPAAVVGTLAPPLPSSLKFKGGDLLLSPVDPLFQLFLGLWQGTVVQTDNGHAATGTEFDDGTFTTVQLPLPPQVVSIGTTVTLSFQGFWKKPSGQLEGSQVTRFFMHG